MWRKGRNILVLCCLFEVIFAGDVGDNCVPTDDVSKGTCTLLPECEDALRHIRKSNFHPYSRCGFSEKVEVVCCPNILRVADRECKRIMNTTLPPLSSHIIGGKDATIGEFPHMVALGYNTTGEYEFRCGGSLITDSYVLTAAHCIDTQRGFIPRVARIGVVDIGNESFNSDSDVIIQKIIVHPNHTRTLKYNDIALLRLKHPVILSPRRGPICLYTKNIDPSADLVVTGWGRTNVTRYFRNPHLQKAPVIVVSKKTCQEKHPAFRRLPQGILDGQICAGDPNGLHDTCQGDSGGPLQGSTTDDGYWRLVAVTSYGRGCAVPDQPGVYTRVSAYLDWIESVVWPNSD